MFNKVRYPLNRHSLETDLFPKGPDDLKSSDYGKINLAGPGPQPAQQQTWWDRLGWRKIYFYIPPILALLKGLLDYSDSVRKYGIYNAGQAGIAGLAEGLAYGIALDGIIASLELFYRYGRTKNWWP